MPRSAFLAHAFLLAIASMLSACSILTGSLGSAIPDWVLNPPSDNAATIYGVGQGRDLDSAKQSGLKDIAGKLSTYIASESENRDFLANGRGHSTFKQRVNTEIKKMKLSSFQVLKGAQAGDLFYSLVALPRAEFVAEKRSELAEINKQIDSTLAELGHQNALLQLRAYYQSNQLAEQAKPLIALIQAADRTQTFDALLADYRDYQEQEQRLLASSKVYVQPNASLGPFVPHLIGILQSHGLQVSKQAGADGVIKVSGTLREAELFASKSVKYEVDVSVATSQGQSLSRHSYRLTGSSVSSYRVSRNQALQQLSASLSGRDAVFALFSPEQD